MRFRLIIKKLPFAEHTYTFIRLYAGRNARFEADYSQNSGAGSTLEATEVLSAALRSLLNSLSVHSMLDIPCGDFLWMRNVDLNSIKYTGADVIETLIQSLQRTYKSAQRNFIVLDIVMSELPKVDLIFCRDCLVHFSNRLVKKAVNNIKCSGSRYLLTTTFPQHPKNARIITGNWRPLNLCAKPFNFSPPIQLLNEAHPAPYQDKSLGLWEIQDLPTF
jgi:hypothetical protein